MEEERSRAGRKETQSDFYSIRGRREKKGRPIADPIKLLKIRGIKGEKQGADKKKQTVTSSRQIRLLDI